MSLFYGYTDEENKDDKEYLPLSGGKLTGDLNMNLNRITKLAAPIDNTDSISKVYLSSYIDTILIETLIWEYCQKAAAMYRFFHGGSSEVNIADISTRKVDRICDQSLSGGDAISRNSRSQPILCTKVELIIDIF